MEKLELNITGETKELVLRTGQALELHEPISIEIDGVIDTPANWIENRILLLNQKECFIVVNREKLGIQLVINENTVYRSVVTGKLEVFPKFKEFSINEGKYLTNFEMAQLFKMNRTSFENLNVAMNLVSQLQNFKAKVDKDVELSSDNRANTMVKIANAVKSNLPEKFKLVIPVFKGTPKQTFEVEVYIRETDLCCSLVSPDAKDLMDGFIDTQIDAVLERIKKAAPEIVIIEQ